MLRYRRIFDCFDEEGIELGSSIFQIHPIRDFIELLLFSPPIPEVGRFIDVACAHAIPTINRVERT